MKSWFEVMNFFIFIIIFFLLLFLRLFCFVRCSSTILIKENSSLCCMSLQSLERFMGNFNFDMQLGMK